MHGWTRQLSTYASALALAALIALLAPSSALANINGTAVGGAGCGGGGCHGPVAGALSVSVSGPATVAPTSTNTYTLTIVGALSGGGFSLETDAGTLSVVDGNTQMMTGMVTHLDGSVAAPAGNIGDWSYDFDFTAPASIGTTITLAFSGLDFDASGTASPADDWNTNTFTIVTAAVPEPQTALLLGMGLGMLGFAGRRRTR
jgi:hypothetical protein